MRGSDYTVGHLKQIGKLGQLVVMTKSSGHSKRCMVEGMASRGTEGIFPISIAISKTDDRTNNARGKKKQTVS